MPENEANAGGSSTAESQAQRATTGAGSSQAANTTGQEAQGSEVGNPEAKKYAEEAAATRKQLRDAQAKLAEYEKAQQDAELAKLGDLEKVSKQLEQVSAQAATYKATIASLVAQLEASKLGIVDPEVAATLIQSKLELGDDGRPTNAGDLLSALLKEKPYLKAADTTQQQPPRAGMTATNAGRGAGTQQPEKVDWKNPPRLTDPRIWQRDENK